MNHKVKCTACFVGMLTAVAANAGEVRVWPSAMANDGAVHLRDVANVSGFNAMEAERIGGVVVGASPRAGGQVKISMEDIRRALDEARINRTGVTLMGAAACAVTTPMVEKPKAENRKPKIENTTEPLASIRFIDTQTIATQPINPHSSIRHSPLLAHPVESDAASLESLLRVYFDDSVKSLGGRAEVRFGAAQRAALALRTPECRFAIHPRGDAKLGMVWVDVEVIRAEQKSQTVPVMAEVTLLRPVVVATRVLNHGQEVTARDVRMETRPFKRSEDVGMTELAAVVGMEARRALHPGDMVAARDIRSKPLVQRNQIVTVWSREGGLVVQMAGRATQEAWLGDVIEIRAEGSQSKFFATVSGPGTVTATSGVEVAAK